MALVCFGPFADLKPYRELSGEDTALYSARFALELKKLESSRKILRMIMVKTIEKNTLNQSTSTRALKEHKRTSFSYQLSTETELI